MIYPNKDGVAIMGKGLLANALRRIENDLPPAVYFFQSVSSIVLFDKQMDYCFRETINDFLNVLQYCRDTGTYLVYPSSATVYNKNTSYARCKAICEELALAYDIPSLGLRIAASYGPGEAHKGNAQSVVYQWTHLMKEGKEPIIYGDGTQTRDFIYEDDVASYIADIAWRRMTGIIDVGTGINTSFNEVVATINKVLGTSIEPVCVPKPKNYVPETKVKSVPYKYSLEDGIKRILEQ
jgi:UDP-glucose 4-epimerase